MRTAIIDMGNGTYAVADPSGRMVGDRPTAEVKAREIAEPAAA